MCHDLLTLVLFQNYIFSKQHKNKLRNLWTVTVSGYQFNLMYLMRKFINVFEWKSLVSDAMTHYEHSFCSWMKSVQLKWTTHSKSKNRYIFHIKTCKCIRVVFIVNKLKKNWFSLQYFSIYIKILFNKLLFIYFLQYWN